MPRWTEAEDRLLYELRAVKNIPWSHVPELMERSNICTRPRTLSAYQWRYTNMPQRLQDKKRKFKGDKADTTGTIDMCTVPGEVEYTTNNTRTQTDTEKRDIKACSAPEVNSTCHCTPLRVVSEKEPNGTEEDTHLDDNQSNIEHQHTDSIKSRLRKRKYSDMEVDDTNASPKVLMDTNDIADDDPIAKVRRSASKIYAITSSLRHRTGSKINSHGNTTTNNKTDDKSMSRTEYRNGKNDSNHTAEHNDASSMTTEARNRENELDRLAACIPITNSTTHLLVLHDFTNV
jgi:hypothetical protein